MSNCHFVRFLAAAAIAQGTLLSVAVQAGPVFEVAQVPAERRPEVVQINSFVVTPSDKYDPGTKLMFKVEGTANSKAFLTVPGSTDPLPMEEVKPGVYERSYVVRREGDQIERFTNVRADLKRGTNVTTATLKLGETAVTPGQGQRK